MDSSDNPKVDQPVAPPPFLVEVKSAEIDLPTGGKGLVVQTQLLRVDGRPITPPWVIPGEALGLIMEVWQGVCEKHPELTTEKLKGMTTIVGPEAKTTANLIHLTDQPSNTKKVN